MSPLNFTHYLLFGSFSRMTWYYLGQKLLSSTCAVCLLCLHISLLTLAPNMFITSSKCWWLCVCQCESTGAEPSQDLFDGPNDVHSDFVQPFWCNLTMLVHFELFSPPGILSLIHILVSLAPLEENRLWDTKLHEMEVGVSW